MHARVQRGGGQGVQTSLPPKRLQNIGFLNNTGPDPPKSYS